jgi:hypothetical protein
MKPIQDILFRQVHKSDNPETLYCQCSAAQDKNLTQNSLNRSSINKVFQECQKDGLVFFYATVVAT